MSNSIFDGLSVISLDASNLTAQQLEALGLLEGTLVKEGNTSSSVEEQSLPSVEINTSESSCIDQDSDDQDLFQCGKCKKQFSILSHFIDHKKQQNCFDKGSFSISLRASKEINTTLESKESEQKSAKVNQVRNFCVSSAVEINLENSSKKIPASLMPPKVCYVAKEVINVTEKTKNLFEADPITFSHEEGQSVVINDGEFLGLALENSQVFTIEDNLQIETGTKILNNDGNPDSFETTDELIIPSPSEVKCEVELSENAKEKSIKSNHEFFHGRMAKSSNSEGTSGKATAPTKHYCSFCCKVFFKNFDLQQHLRSHTGEKPYQCVVCGRGFAQKSNLKRHLKSHKVWPSEFIIDQSEAQKYEKSDSLFDQMYECSLCKKSFPNYLDLRVHKISHKDEKVYRCIQKDCDDIFKDLDCFLNHIRIHEKDIQYRCHSCAKVFNSLHTLGYHQLEHSIYPWTKKTGPRYFRCTKCMNKYSSLESLSHHLKTSTHHYPCKHCDKICCSERMLRSHLKVHGQGNLFKCPTCSKDLRSDFALKSHVLIHTGEKPFECYLCNTSFNRKDKLKRHMLIHQPKKFSCPFQKTQECNKMFSRNDKLRAHILTHAKGFKSHGSSKPRSNAIKRLKKEVSPPDENVSNFNHLGVNDGHLKDSEFIVSCDEIDVKEEESEIELLYISPFPAIEKEEEPIGEHPPNSSSSVEQSVGESITLTSSSLDRGDTLVTDPSPRFPNSVETVTVSLEDNGPYFIEAHQEISFGSSNSIPNLDRLETLIL